MYELIHAAGNTYYMDCPAKVGLCIDGNAAYSIDSGNDKDAAKKLLRHLEGKTLRAVYHTHSHADHIGGSALLCERTGCDIFAPAIECAFTQYPILEPMTLYGGRPPKELRHKFLLAKESPARPLAAMTDGWEAIPLPGHSPAMTGYRTPDNVVFLGDCLASVATLDKYPIGYLYDVGQYLETLEQVKAMTAALFVPAHAEAVADIAPLARRNIEAVQAVAAQIEAFCQSPIGFDELLGKLFSHYQMTMTIQQHALVGSTVRSYLSYLCDADRLRLTVENNRLIWVRA